VNALNWAKLELMRVLAAHSRPLSED
jgi:hypothetical protein